MVTAATLNKQGNELVNLYVTNYSAKYGKAPTINRFKQKWGFNSMIEDLSFAQAKRVIDYYFQTARIGHPIDYLLYNYEKLNIIMLEMEKDERDRAELRRLTQIRVEGTDANGDN